MAAAMLAEADELGPFATVDDPEMILSRVADYDVLRVLGRGGMGVVCRARDRLLGREVALKLMHSGVLASDEELRRFNTEAEAVARLRHPHLVTIYDAGEADGQAYYTMTLAEGGTLSSRLKDGPLPPRAAAELVSCLAEAVHHAHARGVLHRDLKPANVLFDAEGRPLVSDFGLARLTANATITRSGALLGTPGYLAPEVASGAAGHTTSSDVYALGVILYECLTGRPPFEHESPLVLLKLIADNDPVPPSSIAKGVDSDLEAICLLAMEKAPSRRYSSAEALATDLRHWLKGEDVTARRLPYTERFWRWAQRHQARAVLYTMTAVSLVILTVTSAVMNVFLTNEQHATRDSMRRSEARRAELLTRFASRLLQTDDGWDEAADYLTEAATLQTGDPVRDRSVLFRLHILDRLKSLPGEPWPQWDGTGLQSVAFSAEGICVLTTTTGTMHLVGAGALPSDHVGGTRGRDSQSKGLVKPADDGTVNVAGRGLPLKLPAVKAQLSPDGQFVATITTGGDLQIWESANGQAVSPAIKLPEIESPSLVWEGNGKHRLAIWSPTKALLLDW
ncbi:MAG: serine/threonine protein kinase [Verrucomicrobiaceae bacterium]|nr:serine/threonine protein kinase [Verrucomicrobiaceae bacterium]